MTCTRIHPSLPQFEFTSLRLKRVIERKNRNRKIILEIKKRERKKEEEEDEGEEVRSCDGQTREG